MKLKLSIFIRNVIICEETFESNKNLQLKKKKKKKKIKESGAYTPGRATVLVELGKCVSMCQRMCQQMETEAGSLEMTEFLPSFLPSSLPPSLPPSLPSIRYPTLPKVQD